MTRRGFEPGPPKRNFFRADFFKTETLKSNQSSRQSSMVSTAACYRGGPGFKSRQGREFINF